MTFRAGKRLPPMLMSSVPNVPGMRRDFMATHPHLAEQHKRMHPAPFESNQSYDRSSYDSGERLSPTNTGLVPTNAAPLRVGESGFARSELLYDPSGSFHDLKELTLGVQKFPSQAESFSDVSGRYSIRSQQLDRSMNIKPMPFSNIDSVPHFVANEKEPVCRVMAYFIEKNPYNEKDVERARRMELIFHLEDSTLEIIEPSIPNCGIIQGDVLCLQRALHYLTVVKRERTAILHCINLLCNCIGR